VSRRGLASHRQHEPVGKDVIHELGAELEEFGLECVFAEVWVPSACVA